MGLFNDFVGAVAHGTGIKRRKGAADRASEAAEAAEAARRAKMTPEQLAAEAIDREQQAAERRTPDRPLKNVTGGSGFGRRFEEVKKNHMDADQYEALVKAGTEKQKRLSSEVTIAQGRPASRRSTKGGTLRNKQSAGGYESPFASLLGG